MERKACVFQADETCETCTGKSSIQTVQNYVLYAKNELNINVNYSRRFNKGNRHRCFKLFSSRRSETHVSIPAILMVLKCRLCSESLQNPSHKMYTSHDKVHMCTDLLICHDSQKSFLI